MSIYPFEPIKPDRLKRYKDIGQLLIKHGRRDLLQVSDLAQAFLQEELREGQSTDGDPEQLVRDLESMGQTFVKLGQLLSTRPDLLPQPYVDALSRLQDEVAPFPFEQVEEIIWTELGLRVARAFISFDPDPMAAASLGQVHQAQLRDGRIANRITLGLMLAALIVGAALIMRIESAVTVLGYRALAIVLFLLAADLGLVLVFNIFVQDIWRPRR